MEYTKLGHIAKIQTGPFGSQLHQSDYKPSGIPCIMPCNIGSNLDIICDNIAYISEEDLNRLAKHKTQEGDIVYSRRGDIEKCAYISSKESGWLCGTGCLKVSIDNTVAIPKFIAYLLSTPDSKAWLVGNAVGTTMLNLNTTVLSDFPISLPDIETQQKVVDIIDAVADKIELNKRINDNLEQQAEALYKSWFVDFEPFKDQEFVESEFGLIPEGWQCTTLSELLSIKYGKDHKKLAEGTIPVYGSGGLMRYVDTKLHEGEAVLIPRKGTLNNVMYVNEAFWTVDTMFYSIPKQENSCIYAYLFLANKDLASMNAGSAVPSMTTDILNNMLIIAPPAEVLRQFNNICNVYFSRINQNNIENANLSNQRDTLLPKLMSGELKVNEIDC